MSATPRPFCSVIIIGGGFSGVAIACQLKRNFDLDDYCIYDRMDGIGGTWRANTYPGCAVDIPGVCYSLSFAPSSDFSQWFPPQAEILTYLMKVAQSYGVDDHFVGYTEWQGAYWQDTTHTWRVQMRDLRTGEQFTRECRILISAVGGLVDPHPFNAPGIGTFRGEVIHTSRWKSDINLEDKHVAVIGNGASAIQLMPAIAGKAKFITQFMRTPHHIVPSCNYDISPLARALLRYIPGLLFLLRQLMLLYMESAFQQFSTSEDGIQDRIQSAKSSFDYVQETAPAKYWAHLIPTYEFGCKRRVFDRSYTATLHRDDVRLTNDPILAVQPNSIVTRSGETIPADIILLATGFSLTQFDVTLRGRGGKTRQQHWDEYGSKATYQSVAMHGFPNFFYVLGPNSGRAHTSTLVSIERLSPPSIPPISAPAW
ncbi:hypothetical protein ASPZODRAFT_1522618 [Penicilliopsis zonata CBS 506.65]|uniref:FAD/NAD(P)-binding domain-containing protein n=1 Tax=Penicilliopsis zonata CBS 506.65 TaxID=1073090 RepID=A0A1L9SM51_9EURO|nr:hypothetical protein ASPZODRAFT_1522618 [Penicilliopsis zonata CBS 506.65]OJJ48127.1 hypothetical protein ASPZODRAFT_1522618 [Penicilliopsis zonata CBS 506.65]